MVDYRYEGSIRKLSVPMQNADSSQMITNYYSNGQIESMGKVRLMDEGKKAKYGNWIWYDEQGFVKQERSFD